MLLNCRNCLMEFCLYAISVCTLWVYTAACLFPDVRLTLLLILSKWDGSRLSAVEGGDSIVVKCGIRQLKEPCSCTLHKAINRGVCLISVCCRLILHCTYTALVGSSLDFFSFLKLYPKYCNLLFASYLFFMYVKTISATCAFKIANCWFQFSK